MVSFLDSPDEFMISVPFLKETENEMRDARKT